MFTILSNFDVEDLNLEVHHVVILVAMITYQMDKHNAHVIFDHKENIDHSWIWNWIKVNAIYFSFTSE